MLLPALAKSAAAFADAGAEAHPGVFEDGDGSKKHASEEGNQKRKEKDTPVNADLTDARKTGRSDGREDAQCGIGEAQSDGAAEQSENDTLDQEVSSDTRTARSQGSTNSEFLTAAFDADEQQIGNIGAGDQKDHADGTHEDPEDAADVADDVALERTDVGADVSVFKELGTTAGRRAERAQSHWKHASNVGIDLLDSDAWLEPGETVITEVAKIGFVAVKLK